MFLTLLLWSNFIDDVPDVIDSMKVEYVLIDVFAHDREGTPVFDLTKEDFEVKEGRKNVDIELFDTVDYRFAPSPQEFQALRQEAESPDEVQVHPQTVILVLEFGTAEINQIRSTMDQLTSYFKDLKVRPNVNFYAISLDHGQITLDFTNQPQSVYQSLVSYEEKVMKDPGGNLMMTRETKLGYLETQLNDCLRHITGAQDADNVFLEVGGSKVREYNDCITAAHDQFMNLQAHQSKNVLKALERLSAAFVRVPGMKSMYFISPGFTLKPGREAASLSQSYADRFKSGTFTSSNQSQDTPPSPARISSSNLTNEFRRIIHAATANRLVFHTFRFGGQNSFDRLGADQGVAGLNEDTAFHFDIFSEEMNQGLSHLSSTTGGSFMPEGSLAVQIQKVIDGHSFHYVVGYNKPKGSKRFRNVTIKCKRDGVNLSHRSGYFPDPKKAK